MARARGWCLTLNNYTNEEFVQLQKIGDYGILGKEVGENGTPHLQGYLYFKNKISLRGLKFISPRAHFEIAKGTPADNQKYCSKDNAATAWGKLPQQGERTDLEDAREFLLQSEPMRKVSDMMNLQVTKNAEKWLTYNEPKRTEKPLVKWFWGPSGVGKTRKATDELPDAYIKTGSTKWWDGYDAHEDVILDDLRSNHIEFTELLNLLDRYGKRIEHKGGMRQFRAKRIIITSIYSPEEMYAGMQERSRNKEPIEQLLRRIDIIHAMAGDQKSCPEVQGNTVNPDLLREYQRANNIPDNEDDWE